MAEILVCDDDKDIVEAMEIYLAQEGHDRQRLLSVWMGH